MLEHARLFKILAGSEAMRPRFSRLRFFLGQNLEVFARTCSLGR
jgi:hypothetical protein